MISKKLHKPKPGEQIEQAQKLILAQQRDAAKLQDDLNSKLEKIHKESLLILAQIEEMRSGKILFVSRELEEQIKRASRLALAIDRKVAD